MRSKCQLLYTSPKTISILPENIAGRLCHFQTRLQGNHLFSKFIIYLFLRFQRNLPQTFTLARNKRILSNRAEFRFLLAYAQYRFIMFWDNNSKNVEDRLRTSKTGDSGKQHMKVARTLELHLGSGLKPVITSAQIDIFKMK